MSRITRATLAIGASVAALAGGAGTASADGTAARAAAPTAVQLQVEHSGKCLTIDKGSLRNGAEATQAKCADGLDNQLFDVVPTGNATFELRPKHSGKCLEVENSGTDIRANVQQWWCAQLPHQQWRMVMVDVAKESYELRPAHALNRCLDVQGGNLDDGANIMLWYCNSTAGQRWKLLPAKSA
ncbi:RICIN domain-containing protein [Streptomyces sp. UNOB3_S3]|uniref:RICIN domain-containing protein n=1 Tax=Streptomyces sp. UNOB3_S3 TaxID=2871682 RepID=UPI001E393AA5|nr:RICIN domain-containing protein [Streptomyces sp. UNOB3_S3]MCC3776840.1 RICIN domain-containing protein [Streptomyces sp. UNOB3_S3]